jgi:hypothetical protein
MDKVHPDAAHTDAINIDGADRLETYDIVTDNARVKYHISIPLFLRLLEMSLIHTS